MGDTTHTLNAPLWEASCQTAGALGLTVRGRRPVAEQQGPLHCKVVLCTGCYDILRASSERPTARQTGPEGTHRVMGGQLPNDWCPEVLLRGIEPEDVEDNTHAVSGMDDVCNKSSPSRRGA